MIRDLSEIGDFSPDVRVPVCIIGAGTAGLLLARRLRQRGIRVLILEAGGRLAKTAEDFGEHCVQRGTYYGGAELGRSFGLGGTSVLWGGQMIPLSPGDFESRPWIDAPAWPIGFDEIARYVLAVQRVFGLSPAVLDGARALLSKRFPALCAIDREFHLRLSEWLPFGKRNFAKAFADTIEHDPDAEIWLNARAVKLELDARGAGRVAAIRARSNNGQSLTVYPDNMAICAGALESTRLMLECDEQAGDPLARSGAPIGCYFADHLSATCGRFEVLDWHGYNREVAPIFDRGLMRTPRLEVSHGVQRRLKLPSAFCHFVFLTDGNTGLDVVRNVLRRRQGERREVDLEAVPLGQVIRDVSSMAWWRVLNRRLWIPRQADLQLRVDVEQVPARNSRLTLSDERDEIGCKRLQIEWMTRSEDIRAIETVAIKAVAAWRESALNRVARLELAMPKDLGRFESVYDVYHPTGSLRMGSSPADSVVDPNLKVWGLENCYISSTAVFPSAGSANPGLVHLALTERLSERLGSISRSSDG